MDIHTLVPFLTHLARTIFSILSSILSASARHAHTRKSDRTVPEHYNVDLKAGTAFFPSRPLERLPAPFSQWEDAKDNAEGKLCLGHDTSDAAAIRYGKLWRQEIQSMPSFAIDDLTVDIRLLQRAHMVLAFLVQYYVHSMPIPEDAKTILIPRSLSIPLMKVSRRLGIAPVLTFADTVLWNWSLIDANGPVVFENMRWDNLFSGTGDERRFYETSAKAELHGVEMLRLIHACNNGGSRIADNLNRLATLIDELSDIIQSVRVVVDPHVFHFEIREWWEGSQSGGPSTPRWVYEGYEADSASLDLCGPSAGQSSLIHALDLWLGIDHDPFHRRSSSEPGFMERMRRYMPGKHREYLNRLAERPIRDLVSRTPALREPYNKAVTALKKLRDLHIRIAVLYVVSMARSGNAKSMCPVAAMMDKMEARAARDCPKAKATGTGGNELSVLLKAGRNNTQRALL